MNKKIITTGKAVLSTVMASTMVCSMLPMNIYAQGTEEPVIVEENNVSDPNQEKEDEPQASEQEQPEEETVQSEESVDNTVQNTEPQSEEETVEPKKSSQDITFNNPSGVHFHCTKENSSIVIAYGADWMEFQGVRYTDKTTYNQKECIAPEAIRQALIAVPSGTMQTFTIRVGVEGDDVGIEYTFYGDKLDPELTVIEANANYILFEGNEPLDPERTAYESYEENGHYYAKYDLSSAKVGFGSNTIADSTGKNATWFMYEKKADGTVEVHLMDKVPTVEVTSGDSLYKLTDGAVITKKLSKNSFKVSGYGIRSVQAGENMYLYGEKVQNSDLAVTSIDYPITLKDKKTYQLRYENKGGEFSNVNFSVNYSLGSYVDTLNATIKEQEEKELNAENYTPDTWSAYEQALQNAKASAENPFTDNTAMQSAESALKSAFEGLKEQVKDTVAPEVEVTYSNKNGSQVTKEDVTVTLTANEDIQDIEGWTRVDSKTLQKVHSENGKFNVTVKDLAGNETKVKYEVKRIDKVAPVIEGVKDGEVTNKDVEFTVKEQSISKIIIDEKEYNEKNAPKKVSGEGKHTIKVVDKAGNETSVSFTIDQTAPKFTVKEESKGYDGVYSKLSLKLYDAHKVDYVEINGKKKDLSDNQWSDLNDQNAGYKEGKNTVVLYDVAGNSAEFTFIYDKTGPTVTVKDSSVEEDGYYSRLDLKLYDANKIDYVEVNGKKIELSNNQWSDLNHANAGYVDGENTIVVYDQAGNSTTVKYMIGEPVKADKTALQKKIDEAKKLEEDNYTEETWSKLEEALEAAEKVNDNEKATQEEVDKAVADLDAAIKGLEEVVINITANVNGTPVSGETLEDAVTKAGIEQRDVDTVELLTGIITQADLDYLKGSRVTELTINLDADLKMADGSTKMPGSQFQNSRLEKLTLGGFTEIGSRAFVQSTSLKEVSLPDVVTVGKEAFYRCDDYTDVTLPASIQSIGDSAFAEAANGGRELNVVFQGTTPPELGNRPFGSSGTVTVPEGSLTAYLPDLDITKTFRGSGTNKFGNLDVIDPAYQKVKFQYGQYGSNAFYAYYKKGAALNTVEIQDIPSSSIPEGKEFAGWNTKKDGSGTTIADTDAVPADVEVLYPVYEDVVVNITVNIDGEEISGETLQAAVEEAGLTTGLINKVEFVSGKVTKADLEYIAEYADELVFKLSDTLTYVGDNDTATTVFPNTSQNWSQLESLTLEGFTEIAASAFYNHEDLRTVNLTGVEIIGGSAFNVSKNASKKEMNVTISDSIKEIGSKAFYGQNNRPLNLTLNVKDPSTITLNKNAFDGINTSLSKVNVPEGSLQNYLTNLDITKAFNSSTNTKWNKMIVNDPAYQLMTFQYDADYEGVTFNAYIKNGSTLSSISLEDVQTAINNRIPEGYAFAGWNTAVDGTGTDITDETVFPIEAERIYIKLAVAADKTKLQEQIDAVKDLKEEDYVASTWEELQTALAEANKVNEDTSATQDAVIKATEALKTAIENLVKAGMSHVEKITQNDDGSLTISFDRKIKDENGSRSKHSLTFDAESNTITVANVTAEGPLFVHVSTKDYDNRFSHHNLFRDADGTWKVVEEYITGATYVNEKPKISYIVGDEEKTLELQDGVTEYTIETTSEDVSLKIKGHDLEYVTFEYTDKVVPGYSKRFTPSSTDDHTTISFPVGFGAGTYKLGISDQSMSTNAGRYTNIKLTIKVVEPANKTALQEQIEEAEDRNENYYTADTWTKLQEALTSAKAVNDDDSASQTEVDEATSALEAALKALVYEVEGEIYLVIGDEKIPLINLTNTADQSYWEDPYVYDKPLSSNPKIRVEGKDVYQILIKDSNAVGEGRGWKGLASNHVKSKDVSLFAASGYGNDTYKVSVGVDSKIFRIAIEIKDYTLPSNEALKAILDKANAIEKGNYTDESFEALQEAIKLSTTTYQINKNLWDADQAILDRATKRVEDAIAALEVNSTDKTKLQSLVDEVKDFNAEGVTGFDVFQDQLKLAQDVLADSEATQEDIDKRVIQLEGRYYIVQLKALNAKYKDTISGKSSVIYTTDSMKALVEMYEGVKDKSFSANKVLKQTDVDTAKAKLEEYQTLEKELVKASASDTTVGINESALARSANKGQGTFEILSKTAVEGGYELTIKFTNDANHPIFGESYTNYDGTETKFAKFGGTANAKMYVDAYDSSLGAISRPWTSNTSFEALEGNSSKTPGFTTKITVPENTAYVTLSYTYSGATAHSAGYWVVGNIQEVVEVDKTELNNAITEAEKKNESDYTSDSWEAMQEALKKAKEVSEKTDATEEEIKSATDALNTAVEALVEARIQITLGSEKGSATYYAESFEDAVQQGQEDGLFKYKYYITSIEFKSGTLTAEDLTSISGCKGSALTFVANLGENLKFIDASGEESTTFPANTLNKFDELTSVSLKGWTVIEANALQNAVKVKEADLSDVVELKDFALESLGGYSPTGGYDGISKIELPSLVKMGNQAMANTHNLKEVYAPKLESVGEKPFFNVELDKITTSKKLLENYNSVCHETLPEWLNGADLYLDGTYRIEFVNGEDHYYAYVDKGAALNEGQLPSVTAPEGQQFDGWYDGETKVEAGTVLESDVTLTAKYTEAVAVNKDALKEAIDAADAALQLVKSDEVTVSDGETQMDKIFPDARELYENPDATQEQVDEMTENLVAATQYMKEHETWIEILSVGSVENNSISLICNNIPYKTLDGKHKGVALFGDYAKGEAGTNSSLKWDRTRDGSTDYTVINNLEDGENFFYIRFKGYFADEYQDTYWVYVNTTTKEADFGKVGDAVDPSAVVKAGDQDISVSDKEQTISVQGGEKAKLVVTGEDIGYATVKKDGKVVEQTLFPLVNHKTLEVDASEAGEYQVKVVYNWNRYKVSGGNGVYVYDKEVTYNFTIEEEVEPADKTALGEAVESARLALAAVDLKQTTVTDGYDELKELYTKALTLSEDENATQEEVDAMVKELTDAEAYMQSNEAQREMLEIVSQDESTLTFKTNYFPYGVYAYHVDSGQSKTITFTQSKADSTVTAHGLKKGENFFYVQFLNMWTKSQNMYWVYVDTAKNVSEFGKLTDAVQSDLVAIVHVGDKDYPVKTTSASQTIIEVPKGTDEVTVTIQGVDLGYAEVKNKDEGIPQERIYPPYDSDHKSITFKLTDSEGNLAEGPYQALIKYNFRAWEPVTGQTLYKTTAYREFTIKFVEPSTDKTELQSLYDKVKDLQSDVSSFKYFTTQLKAAKNVLDNPQATQDEIDLAIINLEAKYYAVKVAELNVKYNPENDFNFTEYTTESLVPVMNMWGITHNRSNGNYFEDSERGDVGQMKGWYEEYTKAIEGLKEATDESVYIGITSESTKSDDEQGSFEVVSAEKVIVDGQEKIKLVVNYNNTGIHPIYGESLLNANGTKKFKKITSMSEKVSFRYEAYNSEMKHQISAGMSDKTKLPDATNWSAGMQGVCYLDPSISYVTFVINNELYSSWIYRIPELSSPVDKSDLQSLIEETKNYQSDDSYYDEFQEALTNAQNVLSNEEATQEEIDNAKNSLNTYYWLSKAYDLAGEYKPVGAASGKYDGTFDLSTYEAEGALKVVNQYYAIMDMKASSNVEDIKKAYEGLNAAVAELKELPENPRSVLTGPKDDLINLIESRGYFTFEESPAEDGKVNLHIEYVNDGINPINGKDFGEFLGRKFTAKKSKINLQYQTYNGVNGSKSFKDDITLLGGNEATDVDGFEVDVVVEPGRYNVYMELEGVEVYSQGYYYTSESAATGSETSAAKDEVSSDENQSVDSSQETEESTNPFLSFLDSIIQFFKDLF
ncbi:leucine-rich repeat protein [Faecalicoccus pleomorphus]|uniref:leucine-rich repeat protein n=1 Tax=Faecalicoccus pleomorphus TaxID=1323 RepID=UPI0025A4A950|nr:leucine-rich repeat protein [Faecalicoccus pleomorphus]MDM8293478.1 leucine-rich repeat protein [Faecalicoccus pleomorphus]